MPNSEPVTIDRGAANVVCLLKSPALLNAFALSTLTAPPIGIAYLAGTLRDAGMLISSWMQSARRSTRLLR